MNLAVLRSCFTACFVFIPLMCFAELPSAESVLAIHRENCRRLNPLHVQLTFVREPTEARRLSLQTQLAALETVLQQAEAGKPVMIETGGGGMLFPESLLPAMRLQHEYLRSTVDSRRYVAKSEFFLRGENYQIRSPLEPYSKLESAWTFPTTPLSPHSLLAEYRNFRIFSWSALQSPPGRIWHGRPDPESVQHATLTSRPDSTINDQPPYLPILRASTGNQHPIDSFYSAPADRYHVVGQEVRDGRLLNIIDVEVPTELTSGRIDSDGRRETWKIAFYFRAFVDLERGAVPVELQYRHRRAGVPMEEVLKTSPDRIVRATEIQQLPGGGYFPTVTTQDEFGTATKSGPADSPLRAVFERKTWTCGAASAVSSDDSFFVIPFPSDQTFYDLETQKAVGGIDFNTPIKVGEAAPELTLAHWLNGEKHSLGDFRGQVVVLNFWGLWCSACRSDIPSLKLMQQKYSGQPVKFIAIHTAEASAAGLPAKIQSFAKERGWQFLQAVDEGHMLENSHTTGAYGVTGFPTLMVIDSSGKVAFNSGLAPAGMEDLHGKNEALSPADEARMEKWMKEYCEAAGEIWPLPETATTEEREQHSARVNLFHMSRHIDAALSKSRGR